jgi:hypothetical protein
MKSISPVAGEIYIIKKIKQKILTYCSTGSWVSRKDEPLTNLIPKLNLSQIKSASGLAGWCRRPEAGVTKNKNKEKRDAWVLHP